jgi:hypothetical protein
VYCGWKASRNTSSGRYFVLVSQQAIVWKITGMTVQGSDLPEMKIYTVHCHNQAEERPNMEGSAGVLLDQR